MMGRKKGFFQRIREEFRASQEETIQDMRRWGREVAHAEMEGRKPTMANVLFTKDQIMKRWHVDLVTRLRRKIRKAHRNEEADYLLDEAIRCLGSQDINSGLVYLQGAYEKVGDKRIKDAMNKIAGGPSLVTKILMGKIKEKSPPGTPPQTIKDKVDESEIEDLLSDLEEAHRESQEEAPVEEVFQEEPPEQQQPKEDYSYSKEAVDIHRSAIQSFSAGSTGTALEKLEVLYRVHHENKNISFYIAQAKENFDSNNTAEAVKWLEKVIGITDDLLIRDIIEKLGGQHTISW